MKRTIPVRQSFWLGAALVALAAAPAQAITVSKVITNAKSFANHKWTATSANAKVSCYANYVSPFLTKYGLGTHVGLPYDYANWVTLAQFDDQIAKGYGAGSQTSFGVLSCTAGHDCSGFVSRIWEHPKRYTTHYMHQISKEIPATSIAQADIYNYAGKHVVLWDGVASNGAPRFYEAAGGVWKVWYATTKSWSYLSGYVARRYNNIEGSSGGGGGGGGGGGTTPTPVIIPVKTFPFTHSANTVTTGAAIWNDYGVACPPPSGGELGPEIIYALDIPTDGTLKVELSDGVGVDLDVHLLTALDPKSCIARHDTTIGPIAVQAGKRYVVADTWSTNAGVPKPGPYNITISFTSSCAPKTEVCNGKDDDCDGAVDEGTLCNDGLACTDDVCSPAGICEVEPNGKGCYLGGACIAAGATQPGTSCAVCDVATPTVWSSAEGKACADDGNACTNDACQGGICAHPPIDGKACADDGNACTTDACKGGVCAHPPADGKACDDGAPCTASSSCKGGSCVGGPLVQCGPSSGPCTTTACNAKTGFCEELPLPLGTLCAEASCVGGQATPPATCDGAGSCKPSAPYSCGAYACAPNGVCRSDCGSDADCAPQASCVASVCLVDAGGGGGGADAGASDASDAEAGASDASDASDADAGGDGAGGGGGSSGSDSSSGSGSGGGSTDVGDGGDCGSDCDVLTPGGDAVGDAGGRGTGPGGGSTGAPLPADATAWRDDSFASPDATADGGAPAWIPPPAEPSGCSAGKRAHGPGTAATMVLALAMLLLARSGRRMRDEV